VESADGVGGAGGRFAGGVAAGVAGFLRLWLLWPGGCGVGRVRWLGGLHFGGRMGGPGGGRCPHLRGRSARLRGGRRLPGRCRAQNLPNMGHGLGSASSLLPATDRVASKPNRSSTNVLDSASFTPVLLILEEQVLAVGCDENKEPLEADVLDTRLAKGFLRYRANFETGKWGRTPHPMLFCKTTVFLRRPSS
jgi:hypothetical protein